VSCIRLPYDAKGNRLTRTQNSFTATYANDRTDRISSVTTPTSGTSFTVNAVGNMTARGSDVFTYDQVDRLTGTTVGATTASYVYDGDGKRATKIVGSTTTPYSYDVGGGLPVLLEAGTRRFVWGLGLAYAVEGGVALIYHADGLGSVRAITDATNAVVQTYESDEFGVPISNPGTSTQPFDYTGEQRDSESGLMYLRARMYDPSLGRFMQRDVLTGSKNSPRSLNRFSYVTNNPVNGVDPSGLRTYFIGGVGGSDDDVFRMFVQSFSAGGIQNVRGPVSAFDDYPKGRNYGEVLARSACICNDPDAQALKSQALKDLSDNPLADGEQLNFASLSAVTVIAFNAADLLGRAGIRLDNMVTVGGVAARLPSGNGRWTRLSGTLDAYATTPGLPDLHVWMWGMGHDDYLRWGMDTTVTAIRFAGVR